MHYQEILKSHFIRRSTINPRYSLRAFAGFIQLSPSKLSEIWSRKKGLSTKRAQDICERLKLDHDESLLFLTSVEGQHHRDKKVRRKKLEEHGALLRVHNNKNEDKTNQPCTTTGFELATAQAVPNGCKSLGGVNAPLCGLLPVHVSSRELLSLNSRENVGCTDLPW